MDCRGLSAVDTTRQRDTVPHGPDRPSVGSARETIDSEPVDVSHGVTLMRGAVSCASRARHVGRGSSRSEWIGGGR
jgi:hypothetical protein